MGFKQDIYVSVDVVVVARNEQVLLIKRKNEPFKGGWAFPGGFVEESEPLEVAAVRELKEETGLDLQVNDLEQVGAYGDPARDPRFRTVGIVFSSQISEIRSVEGGDDAAEAKWFSLDDLPPLAFDHAAILEDVLG